MTTGIDTRSIPSLDDILMDRATSPSRIKPIPRRDDSKPAPLSFAQQRLWFLDQLQPGSSAYNILGEIRIEGPIKPAILEESLRKVVARHDILRTAFQLHESQPVQIPSKEIPKLVTRVDLRHHYPPEQDSQIHETISREARRVFNLAQGPLIAIHLFELKTDSCLVLVNMHRMISDERSLKLLFREWMTFYESALHGSEPAVPKLTVQYTDYAQWQRNQLQGNILKRQLDYWRKNLDGELPRLELPVSGSRSRFKPFAPKRHNFELSEKLSTQLVALCHQQKVTLFMLLLSAFNTLLHKYSGQTDIIVGSPTENRPRSETEHLIGSFVNTVALRANLDNDPSFLEVLERVRDVAEGAYEHQDLPLERVIELIDLPGRENDGHPLFQVMFALQDRVEDRVESSGLCCTFREKRSDAAPFELALVCLDGPDRVAGRVEYNPDLFEAATIHRMSLHFQNILVQIVDNPEQRISALEMLNDEERRQLLVEWNSEPIESADPHEFLVYHQLFETQVLNTPHAPAIRHESETFSYLELNLKADRLAAHLQSLDVGPETAVGFCIERLPEAAVALLAILKAGGTIVPLDPASPRESIQFILQDSEARLILSTSHLRSRFQGQSLPISYIDTEWEEIERKGAAVPTMVSNSGHCSMLVYPPDASDRLKGVEITHSALIRHCSALIRDLPLTASDRLLRVSELKYDAMLEELFPVWMAGGTILSISPEHEATLEALNSLIDSEQISVLCADGNAWKVPPSEDGNATQLSKTLRLLFVRRSGGPMIRASEWKALVHPDTRLLIGSGYPEATGIVAIHDASPTDVSTGSNDGTVLGRPLHTSLVYTLDEQGHLVPSGVGGELYVGGSILSRGYRNRPDLTEEKYVKNTFVDHPGAMLFYTGDRARILPDGSVEWLRRRDERDEVTDALRRHPMIREVLVTSATEESEHGKLVAYVVTKDLPLFYTNDFHSFLKGRVADTMIPARFVMVETLPQGDPARDTRRPVRKAKAQAVDVSVPARAIVAPKEKMEILLAHIWQEVLGPREFGIHDNFFKLGGTSLSAAHVIARVRKALKREVPLSALFEAPTIEKLARWFRAEEQSPSSCIVPIRTGGSRPPIFWIHALGGGANGSLYRYQRLAEHLSADQPCYGVRAPSEPLTRIPDMAAHYVRALRSIHPAGPYLLGGYGFGGTVAFEMARQIATQRLDVAFLALIESRPYHTTEPGSRWNHSTLVQLGRNITAWLEELYFHYRYRRHEPMPPSSSRLWTSPTPASSNPAQANIEYVVESEDLPPESLKHIDAHWKAYCAHSPEPFPFQANLYRTRHQDISGIDPVQQWTGLTDGRLRSHTVPGTHETLFSEPNVQFLAEKIQAHLDCLHLNSTRLL